MIFVRCIERIVSCNQGYRGPEEASAVFVRGLLEARYPRMKKRKNEQDTD